MGSRTLIAQEQIDHLVDGALPSSQRRALLAMLESEPEGWKRCALAFLEAQAWREAIGQIASHRTLVEGVTGGGRQVSTRPRLVPIALAASVGLVTFLLGLATGRPGPPESDPERLVPVASVDMQQSTTADATKSLDEAESQPSANLGAPPATAVLPRESPEIHTIGYLNFPTTASPGSPTIQLPVLTGPGLDDRWLRNHPTFVPEDVRRDWEQRGYDVAFQRRLVSVQVDDAGRYLTIPVDEVQLRTVDRMTY